ncbi:MAG TPA: DUF488 domain-containing protein [Solirubrobacteraceae bacterium]|nr:DUF488 domain-containing protein [Solirubrobacteraceae bacterium]
MEIYTIGFTQTTARGFFTRLADARIEHVLDIRLNNSSQLAGFAKASDLPYFLEELIGARYEHEPLLAPTKELLDQARGRGADWPRFAERFLALLRERRVEELLSPSDFERRTALLCSEAAADRCHRRLVGEHLGASWPDVTVIDL